MMNSLKEKPRKKSHSQQPSKNKYLGINLIKEVKDFYNENCENTDEINHQEHKNIKNITC